MFVPLTPVRCLHRAVDLFGNKIGIVSGPRQFTYREFGERCERLAGALPKHGVQPGDRVAYLSFNTHQLLEGYYGVVLARAIVMPLNVRLSPLELVNILNHSGARILLFENDFVPLVEQLKRACPGIERFVTLDDKVPAADLGYEELLDQGGAERADVASFDENAIAELFYTSGSTGDPKGVMLSNRTLYLHAMTVAGLYREPETVVDLHTIPLFHANGWGRPQASTMLGTKQIMIRRFDPPAILRLIQEHGATDMALVPTMANALLNCPDLAAHNVSSMRNIVLGGAASSPELIERMEKAFRCDVYAGYGLTETAPLLSCANSKPGMTYASDADRYRRRAMTGWPVWGMEVRVVGPDMKDVPRDMQTSGEIVTRGDHVMEGYFREPAMTAAVMVGGWFHTGDMAVWDQDSFIQIIDRKKEIIISGGENISSIEVEKAISAHPEVFECAVVAAPDETWGEVPAAIVVRKPESALTSEDLLDFLKLRLGKFKLPRIIILTNEPLPKTGTGKIRKLVLREQFWQGKAKRVQG
ncbi:MAG: long-chain-fatty-acid--CoA ligase [Bryobacteraceae bacterium]